MAERAGVLGTPTLILEGRDLGTVDSASVFEAVRRAIEEVR